MDTKIMQIIFTLINENMHKVLIKEIASEKIYGILFLFLIFK